MKRVMDILSRYSSLGVSSPSSEELDRIARLGSTPIAGQQKLHRKSALNPKNTLFMLPKVASSFYYLL